MRDEIPNEKVRSKEDFVAVVRELERSLREKPATWENDTLPRFLEAMAAWTEVMDGYYRNIGDAVPREPSWRLFADILSAAAVYE